MLAFSGPALKRARKRSGRSPEETAIAVGRSRHSIDRYEAGSVLPSVSVVGRLADYLEVSPADLFVEVDDADSAA